MNSGISRWVSLTSANRACTASGRFEHDLLLAIHALYLKQNLKQKISPEAVNVLWQQSSLFLICYPSSSSSASSCFFYSSYSFFSTKNFKLLKGLSSYPHKMQVYYLIKVLLLDRIPVLCPTQILSLDIFLKYKLVAYIGSVTKHNVGL